MTSIGTGPTMPADFRLLPRHGVRVARSTRCFSLTRNATTRRFPSSPHSYCTPEPGARPWSLRPRIGRSCSTNAPGTTQGPFDRWPQAGRRSHVACEAGRQSAARDRCNHRAARQRVRAGSRGDRDGDGQHRRGAARSDGHGAARGVGEHLRGSHGSAGCVSSSGAHRRLPHHGGAAGLCNGRPERPGAAHRPAGGREPSDGAIHRAGVGDGHRRSAARRDNDLDAERQRRSATDAGAADQRPELDGPGPAGAGKPAERGWHPGQPARLLAAQRRRTGDDRVVRRVPATISPSTAATRSPSSS